MFHETAYSQAIALWKPGFAAAVCEIRGMFQFDVFSNHGSGEDQQARPEDMGITSEDLWT
ncbi:MAG: hypothetical protein V4719_26735 [Planctomycetota bacterium]